MSVPQQPDVRPSEALSHIDAALSLNPTLPSALLGKAVALEKMGRLNEATDAFQAASLVTTDDAKSSVLFRLGQLQYMCVHV